MFSGKRPGTPTPSNRDIADALETLGALLELEGAVRHRVLAYRRGAARIRATRESVADMAREGRATDLPDIGTTLQSKILEFADTGTLAALERARARTPEGLVAVARLEGIGPKRALALRDHLGVTDLDGLRAAVAEGRVTGVPGMGERTARALAEQLARGPEALAPRMSVGIALPAAEALAAELSTLPGVDRVVVAGSLRRGRETVKDADLVVCATEPSVVLDALDASRLVSEPLGGGDVRRAVMTHVGLRVEVAVAPPERFGNLLQHATGSAAHNVRLRERARGMGLSMSEYGVTETDGTVRVAATESEVYATLGLRWIPPELREDRGEIEAAATASPPRLVALEDLRGDVHVHTDASDGTVSLEGMAAAARARGYAYLGVADHSRNLAMASGLTRDRVLRQWEAIDALNATFTDGFRVLKCTEMDILADGRLDFDDELLAGFDVVVASLHSGLGRPAAEVTARTLAAVDSPHVDAIGHPTGRMLGRRPGAALDLEAVVERAAATGTLLEINSQPRRLDLDSDAARLALAAGVRLLISSDAHSVEALDYLRFGVLVARRAGARPEDVANTGAPDALRAG